MVGARGVAVSAPSAAAVRFVAVAVWRGRWAHQAVRYNGRHERGFWPAGGVSWGLAAPSR